MTFAEFMALTEEGVVVECATVQQRRNVLELFDENGFYISPASRVHLRKDPADDDDTVFIHPGYEPHNGKVSCYRNFGRAASDIGRGIKYDDIKEIIENPPPLDERSDAEFASDFVSMMY